MTKVVLYLDVDNVINAQMPPWKDVRTSFAEPDGAKYRIRWAQDMIEELKAIPELELVWTTTWMHHAPAHIAPLINWGAEAPFLVNGNPWRYRDAFSLEWKTVALFDDQMANPRPFIWIDDELGDKYVHMISHVDEKMGMLEANKLIIGPKPHLGITPKQIEEIKKFVGEQQ